MILWLMACSSPDPHLVAQGEAVAAFRQGAKKLASDPEGARQDFARAHAADPDQLLAAWQAFAAAEAGDLDAGIQGLGAVVEVDPDFAEARYNLAAFLARKGQLDEAGRQLAIALRYGVRRSRQAMVDPDFAPHLSHPAFSFLPAQLLLVTLDVPQQTMFWGNEAQVRLRVLGGDAAPIEIEGAIEGPVQLVKVLEDVIETSEGPGREVTWVYKVRAAGTVRAGPFQIRAAGHTSTVGQRTFDTTAPPGKSWDEPVELPRVPDEPSEVGARREGSTLWVRAEPGDHVELEPMPPEPPLEMQLLDRSKVQAVVRRYRVEGPVQVRIRRAGTTVYEQRP